MGTAVAKQLISIAAFLRSIEPPLEIFSACASFVLPRLRGQTPGEALDYIALSHLLHRAASLIDRCSSARDGTCGGSGEGHGAGTRRWFRAFFLIKEARL